MSLRPIFFEAKMNYNHNSNYDYTQIVFIIVIIIIIMSIIIIMIMITIKILGGGRRSPGPPKISLFFSLSRRKIRSFLPSRLRGRRGFTRQPENSKREHFRAPAFKKHHQIPREDTQEREEK